MRSSLPEKFLQRSQSDLGTDYHAFIASLNEPAPVSIRLNSKKNIKNTPAEVKAPVAWHPQGRYLVERPVFTLDPLFHAGGYYVQEASSMFVYQAFQQVVDTAKSLKVLDLCAAPGGKTTLLADMLNEESLLVANEVIKGRVGILKENLQKWGYTNYLVANHDAEEFVELEGFFDAVLVDAPCSGEGLFRKDPDASSHWSEEAVQTCSLRQRRILQAAAMTVAPKGVLLYSTCTYNASENTDNVAWLVKNHDFELIELDISNFPGVTPSGGGYQFYPHKTTGEGFFLAALRKKGGDEDYPTVKIKLNKASAKQVEDLGQWLQNPGKFSFYVKKEGGIVAIPKAVEGAYSTVMKALFKRSSGLELGEFKGKDFVPSHALALSMEHNEDLPKLELTKENALLYLKKEAFEHSATTTGWHLVCHEGLGLGWAKVIGERVNNYLPKEWRIRMDLE